MLKTIKINNLQPEKTEYRNDSPLPYDTIWLDKMNEGHNSKDANHYTIQYTLTNGPATKYSQNAILEAFLSAYNRHEDVILSPDDLWLLITINFSKYVNSKSEQLKLNSFYPMPALWTHLNHDEFYRYIEDLLPILNEFIKTYQEKVDIDFWNRIINLQHGRFGSGSTEFITGWILKFFFGLNEKNSNKIKFSDIQLNSIRVPVEVENYATGLKKSCYVLGGFYGIDSTQDHIHKPVIGLAVIEDLTTVTRLCEETKHEK